MRKSLLDVGVTKLNLDGNQLILEGVLGYGSSSIVYEGIYIEKSFGQEFEHKIVLKEFFPVFKDHEESDAFRNVDGSISFPEYIKDDEEYKRYLARFKNAHKIITELNNQKLTEEDIINASGLEGNGTYYQRINLNHGVTLDKFLEKCQDLKTLFNVMKKVAQAINRLHAIGIIHMDIKPSNIFVRENTNNIKLIDVDSFVFLNEDEENETNYVYSATPKYASPQVNNLLRNPGSLFVIKSAINTKSDIYSLAAIVYEAIYGGVLTNLVKKKSDIPQVEEFIREKYPHYSMNAIRKLEEFFNKSLAFNISKRYDSMSDVVVALGALEKLFNPKEVYIKDNYVKSSNPLFGREEDITALKEAFSNSRYNGLIN